MTSTRIGVGFGLSLGVMALLAGCRGCSKSESSDGKVTGAASSASTATNSHELSTPKPAGMSAPIAAAHGADGSVIVAGFDASEKAIRVLRIDAKDHVSPSQIALSNAVTTPDSELKVHTHGADGTFVVWRGNRGTRLVRQILRLDANLAPKGDPNDIPVASCATQDGVWVSDGSQVLARAWSGSTSIVPLPRDKDSGILCGPTRAYALMDEDDGVSVLPLGSTDAKPFELLREKDFGGDDQRDIGEYTVGDDLGIVRISNSGALAIRELHGDKVAPLHRLKTTIGKDDDISAIDASPELVTIVFTRDSSSTCAAPPNGGDTPVASDVLALRVRRDTFEESVLELAKGKCGTETGPFFTGALGTAVSVAWIERAGGAGKARAPIVGLVHASIGASGPVTTKRIEQAADAIVDAGCDGTRCYAAALVRPNQDETTAADAIKVLRY